VQWTFHTATSIGGRKEQQDRLYVISSPDHSQHLAVLADGAGGHVDGARAAQCVVDFAEEDAENIWQSNDPEASLRRFCEHAHVRVLALSEGGQLCCTTVVALLLRGEEAYWAHAGDSRLYLIRDRAVLAQTKDHSLRQLAIDDNSHSSDERKSENFNIPANQLYLCLGVPGDFSPETGGSLTKPGDYFVLCSDGLWGQLNMEDVFSELPVTPDQAFCDRLTGIARVQGGDNGDNISLVLAHSPEKNGAIFASLRSLWQRVRGRIGN
jgi:serine/threonine protein phosphatase PrpC